MYINLLGLSDSENNTITMTKLLVFMIVNTITIVGDQFLNTMIINKKMPFSKVLPMVLSTDHVLYISLNFCQSK